MIRATFRIPGRGTVTGPDVRTAHAALEWAIGYAKPMPFPSGTVCIIPGLGVFVPLYRDTKPPTFHRMHRTGQSREVRRHD